MKKIGITGGIGAGKSHVAKIIQAMGYPVYNSDERAKELTAVNSDIKKGLIDLFGDSIYEKGKLNKTALAKIIFSNESNREKVNSLIHPIVRADFDQWATEQRSELVFNESALLFETGSYKNFAAIILVHAPKDIRIERIMKRDKCTRDEVIKRMNAQLADEEKKLRTKFQISNDGKSPLLMQVENVILEILSS